MQGGLAHHYPDGYGVRGVGRELATSIMPGPTIQAGRSLWDGGKRGHPAEIVPALQRGSKLCRGHAALVVVSLAW